MDTYKLSENQLEKVIEKLNNNYFEADGCDCGSFEYGLGDNLYLYTYRSCRKSGGTPTGKAWILNDKFTIAKKNTYKEKIEDIEDEVSYYEDTNYKLDEEQNKILRQYAYIRSIKDCGYDENWRRKPSEDDCTMNNEIICPICGANCFDYMELSKNKTDNEEIEVDCYDCGMKFKVKINTCYVYTTFI
jgi:hypothetical protein